MTICRRCDAASARLWLSGSCAVPKLWCTVLALSMQLFGDVVHSVPHVSVFNTVRL